MKVALTIVVLALVIGAVYYSIRLPVMQVSHSTGKCVKVLPEGSCDNPPKKYIQEWVK